MTKVLILFPFLSGHGGTETVISNLMNQANKSGKENIQIIAYSVGGSDSLDWLHEFSSKIIRFPKNKKIRTLLYIIMLPFLLPGILIKEKPDIVVTTNLIFWFIAKKAKHIIKLKYKVVAWYHYSYKLKPVRKLFVRSSDYYFAISREIKRELVKLGVEPKKIFVIYNPIMPNSNYIKRSVKHNKFIYVGRIQYAGQKNLQELFKALAEFHNFRLSLYGTNDSKDLIKLKKLANKLEISRYISWKGFVNYPFMHINEADALFLTSRYEGLPMVLAEAISAGLYVVSSDCQTGPREIVSDNNGELYKLGNVADLKSKINHIFTGNLPNQDKMKVSVKYMYADNYYNNLCQIFKEMSK